MRPSTIRTNTILTSALLAVAALAGCETEADAPDRAQAAQALVAVESASPGPGATLPRAADLRPSAPAAPVIETPRVPSAPPRAVDGAAECEKAGDNPLAGYQSLYESIPWGKAPNGNWQGTGATDPEPLKDIADEEMLKRASEAGKSQSRQDALISIARRKLPEALDVIEKALVQGETVEVRETAIAALIEHGGPRALEVMWQGIEDAAPTVRGQAVWAIAMYGSAQAKRGIERGLDDDDPGVIGMAVLALPAVEEEAFARDVLTKTMVHPEQRVWQEAAYILQNIDTPWARRLLADAYEAADGDKRKQLRWSLKKALENRAGRLD